MAKNNTRTVSDEFSITVFTDKTWVAIGMPKTIKRWFRNFGISVKKCGHHAFEYDHAGTIKFRAAFEQKGEYD